MNHRRYTRRNLRGSKFSNFISNSSVTKLLIIANVIFFFLVMIISAFRADFFNYIALNPSEILQGNYLWTLITHMFMHVPAIFPFHLIINMLVLFNLGSFMERIIGKKRFLWFYLISGLVAALLTVVLSGFFGNSGIGEKIFGNPTMMAVGASGAIFAIAGLFVVLTPKIRFSILFLPFFSLPGYIMIPAVLFLFWILTASTGFPLGNTAHFGGFLSGLVFGFYLRHKYKRKVEKLNKMFR